MPARGWFELVAYVLTLACSVVLAKRSADWRIRLLAYTVGLLPLSQGAVLLAGNRAWITNEVARSAEILELLLSALCLNAIYRMNRENLDRNNAVARNRSIEAYARASAQVYAQPHLRAGFERPRGVERRKEPRLAVDMSVTVTALGTGASSETCGRVKDMSGHGLRIAAAMPLPKGSTVKVEGDRMLLLADVCRCEPDAGEYSLALKVTEWLDCRALDWEQASSPYPHLSPTEAA